MNVENIKYIAETKEFFINGKTIKEESLTEAEAIALKKKSKNVRLLVGENKSDNRQILI